jgi:hypothetical protein
MNRTIAFLQTSQMGWSRSWKCASNYLYANISQYVLHRQAYQIVSDSSNNWRQLVWSKQQKKDVKVNNSQGGVSHRSQGYIASQVLSKLELCYV